MHVAHRLMIGSLPLFLLLLVVLTPPVSAERDKPVNMMMQGATLSEGVIPLAQLHEMVAAEPGFVGGEVRISGVVTADFWRDVYLASPEGRGTLRVSTSEHMVTVGDAVTWRGTLKLDEGELFLRGVGQPTRSGSWPAAEKAVFEGSTVQGVDLVADPAVYRGALITLKNGVVTKIRRNGDGVPWLMTVEFGASEVSVELQDGLAPVLKPGDHLSGIRGIWYQRRGYWQLRPRFPEDFLIRYDRSLESAQPDRRVTLLTSRRVGDLLLDEICFDPIGPGETEDGESFAVVNVSGKRIKLDGYSITDLEGSWSFPRTAVLEPGAKLHVARGDERFFFEFGFAPTYSFDENPDPRTATLSLHNGGDQLLLLDPDGKVVDVVLFGPPLRRVRSESSDLKMTGWQGEPVRPFIFNSFVPDQGQVMWRKRDLRTDRRLDTDTASDWISDPDDPDLGRQVAYPGWDRELFRDTARCSETAEVTALVSPDNCFAGVRDLLRSATGLLEIEFYLITHPILVDELLAAMDRGVRVRILLNGEVFGARGGTYSSVRGLMSEIVGHPSGLGKVFLWRNGDDPRHTGMDADIPDRYNHPHQKFIIVDRSRVLIGSDNLTQSSVPSDDKSNGTNGSRGIFLITDASCVVERVTAIWLADCDPRNHRDICLFVSRDDLDETMPREGSDRIGYLPVQPEPYSVVEGARFELSQSPDNALRPDRGYLGLINRAGEGDWILAEQQYERLQWGLTPNKALNPRLLAYLEAARRGAAVRILVNGAGGEPRNGKNYVMAGELNAMAVAEGLDLRVGLGDLPGSRQGRSRPIHNKMLLARIGGEYWSHVGSANGSETAHRFNREVALSVESTGLFEYLAQVFRADWDRSERGEIAGDILSTPGDLPTTSGDLPERW